MKAIKKSIFALMVLGTASSFAYAASDGSLGASSTGTSDISVTTTEMAQITNMANISAGSYSGALGVDLNDDVCIYTNDAGATSYKVTATGNYLANGGAGNLFFVKSTTTSSTIAYTVSWNNTTGAGNTALTANTQSAAITGATNTYPCVTNNANFRVQMTHNDIMSVPAGTYEGTLTLVVVPDNT